VREEAETLAEEQVLERTKDGRYWANFLAIEVADNAEVRRTLG